MPDYVVHHPERERDLVVYAKSDAGARRFCAELGVPPDELVVEEAEWSEITAVQQSTETKHYPATVPELLNEVEKLRSLAASFSDPEGFPGPWIFRLDVSRIWNAMRQIGGTIPTEPGWHPEIADSGEWLRTVSTRVMNALDLVVAWCEEKAPKQKTGNPGRSRGDRRPAPKENAVVKAHRHGQSHEVTAKNAKLFTKDGRPDARRAKRIIHTYKAANPGHKFPRANS